MRRAEMTDLIERLHAFLAGNALLDEKDVAEAADEIERLLAVLRDVDRLTERRRHGDRCRRRAGRERGQVGMIDVASNS